GVELPRRERGTEQRVCPEANVACANKFERALVNAVARLDLFEPCCGWIGLDPGRDPPGRDRNAVLGLETGGHRQHQRAIEARRPRVKTQHALEIGGKGARAGIEAEMNAGTAAVGALTG